jgi:hypothetical protein
VKRFTAILSLVVITLVVSSVVVSAAAQIRDSFVTGDDNDSITWSPSQIIGQTWTASSSYQLSYLEIYMRRVGNPGSVVLLGRTTTGGDPSNTDAISLTLAANNIPLVNGWVRFDLPTASLINIDPGSVYWWGIYTDKGDEKGNYYAIRGDKDNGYAGGTAKNSLATAAGNRLDTIPGLDNLFRIYGDAIISPSPTPILTIIPTKTLTVQTATILPLPTVTIPTPTSTPPLTPTLTPTPGPTIPTSKSSSPELFIVLGIIVCCLGLAGAVHVLNRKAKHAKPLKDNYGIKNVDIKSIEVTGDSGLSGEASSDPNTVLQAGNLQIQPKSDLGMQRLVLPKSNPIKIEICLKPVSDPGKQDITDAGLIP